MEKKIKEMLLQQLELLQKASNERTDYIALCELTNEMVNIADLLMSDRFDNDLNFADMKVNAYESLKFDETKIREEFEKDFQKKREENDNLNRIKEARGRTKGSITI